MFYSLCFCDDEILKPFKNVDDVISHCHYYNGKYIFRRNGDYVEKIRTTTGVVHDHVSIKMFFHNVCQLRMMN